MAITAIASTHQPGIAGGATVTTGTAIDTTGATLIEISTAGGQYATSVTDSKGNIWWAHKGIGTSVVKFYCYCVGAGLTGSGHTFSVLGGSYCAVAVVAYAGTNLRLWSQSAGASVSGTALNAGSVTPLAAPALITTALGHDGVGTPTGIAVSGGTLAIRETQAGVSATSFGVIAADEIQSVATARNPAWSWTGSRGANAVTACYYEVGGSGSVRVAGLDGGMRG